MATCINTPLYRLSPSQFGRRYLDYKALVRPHVIIDTFRDHVYEHNEDFFFRSVHLGTECWAYIALKRLDSAKAQLTNYSHWHNAAAHILSATHILSYLGDHIMMLTSMVLRDYLRLKVEVSVYEERSGDTSVQLLLCSSLRLLCCQHHRRF